MMMSVGAAYGSDDIWLYLTHQSYLIRPTTSNCFQPLSTGRIPIETLLPHLALGAEAGQGSGPGGSAPKGPLISIKTLPGWQVPTQEELTRHDLYRPMGEACEVQSCILIFLLCLLPHIMLPWRGPSELHPASLIS